MIFSLLFLTIFFFVSPLQAQLQEALPEFDHSEWDQFLKVFVNAKGEVDYAGARQNPQLLTAYLKKVATVSHKDFSQWSREERIATLLNVFNAGAVKLVLENYPLKSVMDIPSFWDLRAIPLRVFSPKDELIHYSLNQIQHDYLRSSFRDEKILFGICFASKGSPPLRREAFTGPKLEGQLYLATRQFVNDETKHRIVPGEKKIFLSRIFQWYAEDFLVNWSNFPGEVKWKPQEMAVLSFFVHYLDDPKKVDFLREGHYKVKYEVFDWRLNDLRRDHPT